MAPGSVASGDRASEGPPLAQPALVPGCARILLDQSKRIVAYHALTLTQELAGELERGLSDLPLDRLPGAERCEPGQPVRLIAPAGSPAALAVVDPENQLVRAFARASEAYTGLDANFFRARVRTARTLRAAFGIDRAETTHRLIHGAGDGLPGMSVDVYGDHAVLYAYSRGLLTLARLLARALLDELGLQGVVIKLRAADSAQGNLKQEVLGNSPPEQFVAHERGLPLEVHLLAGLNVGLFTDMREHRARLARCSRERNVLNLFSYTGSLSVAAARAGARQVTSVDLANGVHRWARENFKLSGLDPDAHRFETGEVSGFLKKAARGGEIYDLIIIDPPTYSAARASAWSIRKDYPDLIARACGLLSKGGLLWLAANRRDFPPLPDVAREGFQSAGRSAQLLEVGGLPPDYPTLPAQPADRYLQVNVFAVS
jgi:23S rRNA (cytosine1962-C5)-methyltransferase